MSERGSPSLIDVSTAMSLREFRSYEGTYLNLSGRLHWGLTGFDDTRFFYASPYGLQQGFGREGAFATQRYSGALALAQYPLDKFRRLEVSAGYLRKVARDLWGADWTQSVLGF